MSDEQQGGLKCPHCHKKGTLKVAWTRVKGDGIRRDIFRCSECGESISGWMCLDDAQPTAWKPPFPSSTPLQDAP